MFFFKGPTVSVKFLWKYLELKASSCSGKSVKATGGQVVSQSLANDEELNRDCYETLMKLL